MQTIFNEKQVFLLFMASLWREGKDEREFVIITKVPVGVVVIYTIGCRLFCEQTN
jgi:hypothetical protein